MRSPIVWAALSAAALGAAGCGGHVSSQESDVHVANVAFAPQVGTAGYGAISGYSIKLTDGTSDGAKRALSAQLSDIANGTYRVGGSGSPGPHGVTYVVKQAQLTQVLGGVTTTFHATSGTVTLTGSPSKVQAPGSPLGSFGSVLGHIDLVLVNDSDASKGIHVTADYVASVTTVG